MMHEELSQAPGQRNGMTYGRMRHRRPRGHPGIRKEQAVQQKHGAHAHSALHTWPPGNQEGAGCATRAWSKCGGCTANAVTDVCAHLPPLSLSPTPPCCPALATSGQATSGCWTTTCERR